MHFLRHEGHRCDLFVESDDLQIRPAGYDCILINCALSDVSGIRMITAIRKMGYDEGIILLSVQDTPEAAIAGLDAGADDYLAQPVHFGELNARIGSLFRRKYFAGNQLIIRNELSIDLPGRGVFVNEKPVGLTPKEFDLLVFLASQSHKIVPKATIANNLSEQKEVHENADFVYAHVKNLKRKLAAAGSCECIVAVYGMGYKFV